jgi:hypothetical protein
MKVSELISLLDKFMREHGDIEIRYKRSPSKRVTAPSFRHLLTDSRFWDGRFNKPESKGKKVCVL